MSEFALIERHFTAPRLGVQDECIDLGIGDDAALLRVPGQRQLVVCADTLVCGVHFPACVSARDIGYRALAVNLSDMAAMAAEPRWYTLCLTMPASEDAWVGEFCSGLAEAARPFKLALVGGDTTSGPLTVSLQLLGLADRGKALRRSGAQVGDVICVTGFLGDAAAGLTLLMGQAEPASRELPPLLSDLRQYLEARFLRPSPRVKEAALLIELASSCIDISDGLLADLGHICKQSNVGAHLQLSTVPLSPALNALPHAERLQYAMSGGDDYELCFTVPEKLLGRLERRFAAEGCPLWRIGTVVRGPGVQCLDDNGNVWAPRQVGFEHFR